MFENPRRGRQARNFTTNAPKILDLKSSSEQIFSRKLPLGAPEDLIVKEQFIDSCPKELAIHLRERAPETLAQIAEIADQYLEAHGKHLFSSASKKPQVQPKAEETKTVQSDTTALQCYKCNARGHKAINLSLIHI